jgi:lysophospholipase L1-like esterase
MFVPDPVLPHRPRPGSVIEGRSRSGEFDFHYAHNALGYRDREHSFEKPPGTFRILGLGDSFTYGAGAAADATFLARLERALNERPGGHPRVEVVNAGIPSFFPEAERLLLEHEGLRFAPDLVVVGFVPNDVIDTYRGLKAIRVLPNGYIVTNYGAQLLERLGPVPLLAYERSHAARIAIRALLARTLENERPVRGDDVYRPGGYHEDDWLEVLRQYDRMAARAREHGAGLAVVHLPAQGPWDERHAYPAERLAAWAAGAGASFVDTLPALRRHPHPESLYWALDGHPTDAGHAVMADALLAGLTERGLVP